MSDTAPARPRRLILRNTLANLARGMATTLVTLLLPVILVRSLPAHSYTSWVLCVQLSTYILFLEAGTQVSVGKFVARERATGNQLSRDAYLLASLVILAVLTVLGLVATQGP